MSASRDRMGRKNINDGQVAAITDMSEAFVRLGEVIEAVTAPSREQSLALTALEEAKFWTTQSIALNGVKE